MSLIALNFFRGGTMYMYVCVYTHVYTDAYLAIGYLRAQLPQTVWGTDVLIPPVPLTQARSSGPGLFLSGAHALQELHVGAVEKWGAFWGP